jgi:predicted phosphodiesterase
MVRRTVLKTCTRINGSFLHLTAVAGAAAALACGAARAEETPANFKVAFFGDQGLGSDSEAVLQLVLAEGASAIVQLGDFDYDDDPQAWYEQIQSVLPPCFPFFAIAGNHDEDEFAGYQSVITSLLSCAGIAWHGEAGRQYSFTHKGIFFVLTTPGLLGSGDSAYVADRLASPAAQAAAWRVSGWHLLMRNLQIGGKGDESGWPVYEESRLGGAIVATGHEHSYERTNLLSDFSDQAVAGEKLVISEGRTFAFVSGLGGQSIRDQERCLPTTPPYGCGGVWASIYAEQQGANYGVLFLEFNYQGDPCLARGYFKDIAGNVPDEFMVRTTVGPCGCPGDANGDLVTDEADTVVVFDNWGCEGDCAGDVNHDQVVDIRDHLLVLETWGDCGATSEPLSAPGKGTGGDQHGNNPRAVASIRDPFAFANDLLRGRSATAATAPRRPEAGRAASTAGRTAAARGAGNDRLPRRDRVAGAPRGAAPGKVASRSSGGRRSAPAAPKRGAGRSAIATIERGSEELAPQP